jgi:peptidoglycan hydrolase-like protein with peptidoglycan-binding domain
MANPATLDRYKAIDPGNDRSSKSIRRLWGVGNGEPLSRKKLMASRSKVALYTGAEIVGGVHRALVPAVQAMSHVMALHNYRPVHPGNWGVAYRPVRGRKSWSLHAFGCAVDIGAPVNPMTSRFVTDMPPALISDLMAIRSIASSERVWTWGGFWGVRGKRSDAMHFQANCGPKALGKGVRCHDGTVFKPVSAQAQPSSDSDLGITSRVLSIGSKHSEVADIQTILVAHGLLAEGLADSSFGPATREALLIWQGQIGVNADGIWGPTTARASSVLLAKEKGKKKTKKPKKPETIAIAEAESAVARAYLRALGREPHGEGLDYWVQIVTSGKYSELELLAFLHASEEGRARSRRLADALVLKSGEYLTALFEERVGIPPTGQQLAVGTAKLASFTNTLDITSGGSA